MTRNHPEAALNAQFYAAAFCLDWAEYHSAPDLPTNEGAAGNALWDIARNKYGSKAEFENTTNNCEPMSS
ncbi:uncharacterized protein N7469_010793 [Penicillium citrinum]|uniref:Uncharacterized protein n=1 Tax=Penicillium citrinum TaxID=5077 RepID=A0A9W9NLB3_PENCI|nr:uncharacterized protein N7469_010793 [Penicillium citrinum]KAJ5221906.1 hypothetical protein N7469_010793 [Penicillium citrinum]